MGERPDGWGSLQIGDGLFESEENRDARERAKARIASGVDRKHLKPRGPVAVAALREREYLFDCLVANRRVHRRMVEYAQQRSQGDSTPWANAEEWVRIVELLIEERRRIESRMEKLYDDLTASGDLSDVFDDPIGNVEVMLGPTRKRKVNKNV